MVHDLVHTLIPQDSVAVSKVVKISVEMASFSVKIWVSSFVPKVARKVEEASCLMLKSWSLMQSYISQVYYKIYAYALAHKISFVRYI